MATERVVIPGIINDGLVVPQGPNDEPAEQLLARIPGSTADSTVCERQAPHRPAWSDPEGRIGALLLIAMDTNVLVQWVRQDRTGKHLRQTYNLDTRNERPLVSTITEGEILGLARFWNWGKSNSRSWKTCRPASPRSRPDRPGSLSVAARARAGAGRCYSSGHRRAGHIGRRWRPRAGTSASP